LLKRIVFTTLVLILVSLPAVAQTPAEEWRTIKTKHFRIHFPSDFEPWARSVAEKIESIRSEVTQAVGYEPREVVDVIVMDPVAEANGSAWPMIGWPRMILWTSPPSSASVIGNYTDWAELVVLHEDVHLVHLLRESRNPVRSLWTKLSGLPLGPITGAPRWISEGYATVLEGELTGRGRPNSEIRAAVLRAWAQSGRLPSYGALNSDSSSWMGMSMAYLVGSAYLEWLRDRTGPDSLRHLWARMTARQERSFEEAFRGVYGDTPQKLYARFTAELTRDAMLAEERRSGSLREGEIWQDLKWSTDAPALSTDGKLLATVIRSRDAAPKLVVWETAPDEDAEKKYQEKLDKVLKRDPLDVAPVRNRPLAREPKFELASRSGANPVGPRWSADGKHLFFVQSGPDEDGMLHPDLYRWIPETGDLQRLTHEADVRDFDPAPDGSWGVAVRHRRGASQLVRVSLGDGDVTDLTAPSFVTVFDDPRVSPDGKHIVYVRNARSGWELVQRELTSGSEQPISLPAGATVVSAPDWKDDGSGVVATVGTGGSIDLWELDRSNRNEPRRITLTSTAATNAAVGANEIYFLHLDPDGLDVRRIAASTEPAPSLADSSGLVALPSTRTPKAFARADVGASTPYSPRTEASLIWGGLTSSEGSVAEAGLRFGDVVGLYDAMVLGAFGDDDAVTGYAAAGAWRGFPIEIGAHLYSAERGAGELEGDETGGELSAALRRYARAQRLDLRAALHTREIDGSGETTRATGLTIGGDYRARPGIGDLRFPLRADLLAQRLEGDDESATNSRGLFEAGLAYKASALSGLFEIGRAGDSSRFTIGGAESSILPWSSRGERVTLPALGEAAIIARDFERAGARLVTPLLPLTLFYDIWSFDEANTDELEIAGAELDISIDSFPVLRLPAASLRLGGGRILEGVDEGDDRYWLSLTWRP
jgi:hypothetical protein